jgi:hypothetical protein
MSTSHPASTKSAPRLGSRRRGLASCTRRSPAPKSAGSAGVSVLRTLGRGTLGSYLRGFQHGPACRWLSQTSRRGNWAAV